MKQPQDEDTEVFETATSVYWFDESGILCSVSKRDAPTLSPEESLKDMQVFFERHGQQKHCILIDAEHAKPRTKEERQHAAEMLPKVTRAMAVIVYNPLGRMLVNLFIGLQKPPYPLKVFNPGQEEKAKEWLSQYL